MGWGDMLKDVLKSRGWSLNEPCFCKEVETKTTETVCVFTKEFEAMLRRETPKKAFGKEGAVEDGHTLRTLPLPTRALWLQSCSSYRVPGPNTRTTSREDFSRLVAKYGHDLPGNPGDFRIVGFPGVDNSLAKTNFSNYFCNAPWYPKSYVLPMERLALLKRLANSPQEYWITKPRNLCAGAGIAVFSAQDPLLTKQVRQSAGEKSSIVQQYIAHPLLLGGYKFHMRIHMVVTSLSPPEAFVQAGGQCLFSTKPYSLAKSGLGEHFDAPVHISNTGLNTLPEQHESFMAKKPIIGKGQQILMHQLEAHLTKNRPGFNRDALWSQIMQIAKDVVVYLGEAPGIQRHAPFAPEKFFDIYGMDLMVDRNLKVWMCETNNCPSLGDQDKEYCGKPNPDFGKENKALSQVWHDLFTLLGLDASRKQSNGTLRHWYQVDFSQ